MERLNGLRGAIFDLDGTLLDSLWIWEEIDRRFFASRNIPMPPDYLDAVNSMEFAAAAEYTVKRFNLPDSPQALAEQLRAQAIAAYADEIKLKPYAKSYLRKLSGSGVKLAVVTSSLPDLYVPSLINNGIFGMFTAIINTVEADCGKDDTRIYLQAACKLGVKPCECAVFDDLFTAIQAAKKGGFITVGVFDRYSAADAPAIKAAADLYINGFSQLAKRL